MAEMDFETCSPDELLDLLAHCGLDVPKSLPEAIVARGSEMLDRLCAAVSAPESWDYSLDDEPEAWLPVHAMHLIGGIGDPAAIGALLAPMRSADFDEFYHEDGPGIIAHLGPGAVEELQQFARESTDPNAMSVVLDGLHGMGILYPECAHAYGELARELVQRYYDSGARIPALVAAELVRACDPQDRDLLQETYHRELWDDYCFFPEWDNVEESLAQPIRRADVEDLTRDPMAFFSRSTLAEWRAVFGWDTRDTEAPEAGLHRMIPRPVTVPTERRPAKPGRNAPCPCGSGKKYKRCCGR